jgi:hypothetical protein
MSWIEEYLFLISSCNLVHSMRAKFWQAVTSIPVLNERSRISRHSERGLHQNHGILKSFLLPFLCREHIVDGKLLQVSIHLLD